MRAASSGGGRVCAAHQADERHFHRGDRVGCAARFFKRLTTQRARVGGREFLGERAHARHPMGAAGSMQLAAERLRARFVAEFKQIAQDQRGGRPLSVWLRASVTAVLASPARDRLEQVEHAWARAADAVPRRPQRRATNAAIEADSRLRDASWR
ncbi:MAG: hypothetical protein QM747_17225 [Nocardioides sp.]